MSNNLNETPCHTTEAEALREKIIATERARRAQEVTRQNEVWLAMNAKMEARLAALPQDRGWLLLAGEDTTLLVSGSRALAESGFHFLYGAYACGQPRRKWNGVRFRRSPDGTYAVVMAPDGTEVLSGQV